MEHFRNALADLRERAHAAQAAHAARADSAISGVRLLAVSKARSIDEVRAMCGLGQRAFGENYVQEAVAKQQELADQDIEWHLIGPLQSNKARDAATAFNWVQTIDRTKLVAALARYRPTEAPPLNVLIQVNIDDESSKSGCAPAQIAALSDAIAAEPRLALRGLMAIPAPHPDMGRRRDAFRRMRMLFDSLRAQFPRADTLSMGMSEDFELAIAEGATMVRVGSALFGARPAKGSG